MISVVKITAVTARSWGRGSVAVGMRKVDNVFFLIVESLFQFIKLVLFLVD